MEIKTTVHLPVGVLNVLNSVYNSKRRHYHSVNHINRMISSFREIAQTSNTISLEVNDWNLFQTAILFHDIVMFEENCEEKSALIAISLMKDYYLQHTCSCEENLRQLQRLIEATDYRYVMVESFEENLIRDLDLEGLADPWEKYLENRELIKAEYPYPEYYDLEFVLGRKKFLQHMLEFPKIYSTKYFKHLEDKARENLQRELDM